MTLLFMTIKNIIKLKLFAASPQRITTCPIQFIHRTDIKNQLCFPSSEEGWFSNCHFTLDRCATNDRRRGPLTSEYRLLWPVQADDELDWSTGDAHRQPVAQRGRRCWYGVLDVEGERAI